MRDAHGNPRASPHRAHSARYPKCTHVLWFALGATFMNTGMYFGVLLSVMHTAWHNFLILCSLAAFDKDAFTRA